LEKKISNRGKKGTQNRPDASGVSSLPYTDQKIFGGADEDLKKKKIIIVTYGSVVRRGKIRVGCYTGGGQKL
jgi:hypothetical protein